MQSKNAGKRKKKIPFKAQKIRALKRARENPEFSSAFGKKLTNRKRVENLYKIYKRETLNVWDLPFEEEDFNPSIKDPIIREGDDF